MADVTETTIEDIPASGNSLPVPANTSGDVYHAGNTPPAPADIEGVAITIKGNYQRRMESGEGLSNSLRFTHVGLVGLDIDIRDGFTNFSTLAAGSSIYINGTRLAVVFVERINRGTTRDCKRVYLNRDAVDWANDGAV